MKVQKDCKQFTCSEVVVQKLGNSTKNEGKEYRAF